MSGQKRPYVMDTGWQRGIHGDLDGEALYHWAVKIEAALAAKYLDYNTAVKKCNEQADALARLTAERDEAREAANFMLYNPSIEIYHQLKDRWPWLKRM